MNNRIKSLALLVNLGIYGVAFPLSAAETATDDKNSAAEETMVVTAAEQHLQAPGVSTITADEIRKRPPARDVSEIIRTMPGVNLTGNSTSGQRGNNRQIDIRGMGPENTLILIDGKPVTSRNSVRLGWRGERDTRGDTSWVPPEMIERIEVIRGPAAARYGNGAAGGLQAVEDRVAGASGRGLPLTPRGCRALASVSTIAHGTAAGRLAHGALATHAGLAGLALGRSLSLLHARAIAVAVIVALLLVGSRITVVILFVSIVPHDGTSASRTIGGCVRSRQIVSVYLKSSSMPARTHP